MHPHHHLQPFHELLKTTLGYSIALTFELTHPPRFSHYMQEAEFSHYSELVTATFSLGAPIRVRLYYQNVLYKIDCRVMCKKKKKNSCNQLLRLKVVVSYVGVVTGLEPFKWAKSADVSYLPHSNRFVCGPNPPPVSKEYWALSSIHFLLPWPFILIRE